LEKIKENFPFIKNFQGIYADSACKTPVPKQVIDAMRNFHENYTGCFYKGGNTLASEGTELLEGARMEIAKFLGARSSGELVWTNGVIHSLNIFIKSYCSDIKERIPILLDKNLSISLIIPWLNPKLNNKFSISFTDFSLYDKECIESFKKLLERTRPKIVIFPYISHLHGQIYPLEDLIKQIHDYEAKALVDLSHALSHSSFHVDDQKIDFAIGNFDTSFGPSGIGFLYGNISILDDMLPEEFFEFSLTEVDTINSLTNFNTVFKFKKPPERFEGLSNNYSAMIGAAESAKFIKSMKIENIINYEQKLSKSFLNLIKDIKKTDYNLFTSVSEEDKVPIFSLGMKTINPHDLALMLDSQYKIASYAGFLSSSHILRPLGYDRGINLFSFSIYNSVDDIEIIIKSLSEVIDIFI
jgi:cysteine desulfurase/selenocysteine lyase